ncbi:MAG: DUF5331 domain-containing protein [Brasilonema octagenarum HA4186-MV1]|jgi:hypothetical protein|uniref:DUF5331 domain-containing protein n=1 Tax=Brasilonema octagenarum TaxID=417105 RepID=UPI00145CCFA6|nr:DUF5331 domain-containing protein [Brasilonema octagenarum HA4186-MV1]
MNIQQLRQSLKLKWVSYYYKNRSWLEKMRVWGTYDAQRRPSSGFILAALSALEPQLEEVLPLICELNNDPDQIVVALGLNFNPEEELHLIESADSVSESEVNCESVLQKLPEYELVSPSVVATAKEDNSKFVPSVAVSTAVPFQTLNECKYLTFAGIANEEKSQSYTNLQSEVAPVIASRTKSREAISLDEALQQSAKWYQPVQSVEVASTQKESNSTALMTVASTQVESKSQFIPLVAFSKTEIESKSQSVPSVSRATRKKSKSKPKSLPAVASDGPSKSKPVSSTAVIPRKVESKAVSSLPLANKVESKSRLVTTPHKNPGHQVNPPPAKITRLANWIDDSCQGIGWDRE